MGNEPIGECFHSFFKFPQTFTSVSITLYKHVKHVNLLVNRALDLLYGVSRVSGQNQYYTNRVHGLAVAVVSTSRWYVTPIFFE